MTGEVTLDRIAINSGASKNSGQNAEVSFRIGGNDIGQIDTLRVWFHHDSDPDLTLKANHDVIKQRTRALLAEALAQLV